MKRVIWKGESRVLPGYGLAVPGQHVSLPEDLAKSYVAQDLAEFETSPKTIKKSTTQQED